jgi:hypothetical protein
MLLRGFYTRLADVFIIVTLNRNRLHHQNRRTQSSFGRASAECKNQNRAFLSGPVRTQSINCKVNCKINLEAQQADTEIRVASRAVYYSS